MIRLHEDYLLGGRYRLLERISAGGMGEVWLANDERLSREVAVKVMHSHTADDEVFAQRFREEATHAAQLQHPNIVAVYDFGDDRGLSYLVMEFVDGPTLSQVLRAEGALEPGQVRGLVAQVASALAVAHEKGIIHRDIKPANILIARDGTAKIMDFGIARATASSGLTRTGEVLGTPHYLSPEQALGQPASVASDLYALGVVAHELLSGSKPFNRETPVATALAQINDPPPALPSTVPGDLASTINQLLAKDPAVRPVSARVLVEQLGAAVSPGDRVHQAVQLAASDSLTPLSIPMPSLAEQAAAHAAKIDAERGAADRLRRQARDDRDAEAQSEMARAPRPAPVATPAAELDPASPAEAAESDDDRSIQWAGQDAGPLTAVTPDGVEVVDAPAHVGWFGRRLPAVAVVAVIALAVVLTLLVQGWRGR